MSLSQDILATLSYYDALDTPLSSFEVWKHLMPADSDEKRSDPVSLGEVVSALEEPDLRSRIRSRDGFFCLPDREELISRRLREDKTASAKLRRVRRLAAFLRVVPFVRMVGVTGSLSMKRGSVGSDWDLFVVLERGRIWTGRTILTILLHVLGKRRHGRYRKDRACLNYFVTDDRLEIPTRDLFSAHEYTSLIPLFGRETFRRFELANRWIAALRPNFRLTEVWSRHTLRDTRLTLMLRDTFEQLFDSDRIESWLGRWQKEKIRKNPKTATPGGRIEVSETSLVFLPDPHGPRIYERFRERFGKLRLR